jgi:hypothetical protein
LENSFLCENFQFKKYQSFKKFKKQQMNKKCTLIILLLLTIVTSKIFANMNVDKSCWKTTKQRSIQFPNRITPDDSEIFLFGNNVSVKFKEPIDVNIVMHDEHGAVLYNETVSLDKNEVFCIPISLEVDVVYYFTITHHLYGQIRGYCQL